jgi:acetyl-CoA synthetase
MERWGFSNLSDLYAASVDTPDWFWRAAVEDLAIPLVGDPRVVCDLTHGRQFPRWFPGCSLNIVTSCVDRYALDPRHAQRAAIIYEGDSGARRILSFLQLKREVDRFAAYLRRLGVGKGDRVALFVPPVPEAAVALLGSAKIGAIIVPAFSGYGSDSLATRLQASGSSVLVTVDGTTRRGRPVPMKAVADAAVAACPAIRHIIVAPGNGDEVAMTAGRDHFWAEIEVEPSESAAAPEALDPNHPLFILYTSGTTGAPKGIVHSHIGYLLKTTIDFGYAFDLQADDTLGWIADIGWMLGPLMIVGGLHLGVTLVLIEGVPDHPAADRLWRIVERNRVTLLGIAPTAARSIRACAGDARPEADLSSLRAFASTGEAWDEPTWRWLFEQVGQAELPIINYSGGTEIGGSILSCFTITPQTPASFSGPMLGMDVDVYDADGHSAAGIGELVVLNSWPGMAHGFWQDEERYLNTYWNRWSNVWVHGDLASVDRNGYWHIHGRSDDTIKIGGRRVGPAEIESALVTHPQVAEAAVIGAPDALKGQKAVAFVVARPGTTRRIEQELIETVISRLGKGLAPAYVHVVSALPKTKNGKIMRRAIRARYIGEAAGDLSALDPSTPLESIPVQEARSTTSEQKT